MFEGLCLLFWRWKVGWSEINESDELFLKFRGAMLGIAEVAVVAANDIQASAKQLADE